MVRKIGVVEMYDAYDGFSVRQPEITVVVHYAGFWTRFFASILDGIIEFIISMVIILPFFFLFYHTSFMDWFFILLSPILVVIYWLYESFFISSKYMATPGKMALKIKVTDMEGDQVSFLTASIRYLFKGGLAILSIIPILGLLDIICLIGPLFIPFTAKKQALYDMIAGTIVVETE